MSYWIAPSKAQVRNKTEIFRELCELLEIEQATVKSKSRLRPTVINRSIISHVMHRFIGFSSTEVGKMLNRDHATILHACNMNEIDRKFDKLINEKTTICENYFSNFKNSII